MKIIPYAALAAALLCACDDSPTNPGSNAKAGSPEAYLAKSQTKWDKVAGGSYSVTFSDWDLDGTTYYECHAKAGRIDSCQKTYRPSGDEVEHSVVKDHDTPGDYLGRIARDLGSLKYDSSQVTDTGFAAYRKVGIGEDGQTLREGMIESFDTTYGYPKTIFYDAGPAPWVISITAFKPE